MHPQLNDKELKKLAKAVAEESITYFSNPQSFFFPPPLNGWAPACINPKGPINIHPRKRRAFMSTVAQEIVDELRGSEWPRFSLHLEAPNEGRANSMLSNVLITVYHEELSPEDELESYNEGLAQVIR